MLLKNDCIYKNEFTITNKKKKNKISQFNLNYNFI